MFEQYSSAERLEIFLGSPDDPCSIISFNSVILLDEQDAYPHEAHYMLNQWGLHEYYVPVEYGGKFVSFEELLALVKVLARRDLTMTIAHASTYLASIPIWGEGSKKNKQEFARMIQNKQVIAFGLTEKDHGTDLLASEVVGQETTSGYFLSGQKWLINNATNGSALVVFARTENKGGPRSFSLFLVKKGEISQDSYTTIAKLKTHGIRGADISGINFDNAFIKDDTLIGRKGAGLEIALKSLQITRTMCAGLSLGAAHTALDTTLRFALSRKLYNDSIFAIPHVQKTLSNAFLDILVCDIIALIATRGLHIIPEQFSVWSAIVKYYVPTTIETAINEISAVLGARYYLRKEYRWGIFQKILRDNTLVSLFDGNTAANLHNIALQLPSLYDKYTKRVTEKDEQLLNHLYKIFDLQESLPSFQYEKLELFNYGFEDVLQGLPLAVNELDTLKNVGNPDLVEQLTMILKDAMDEIEKQHVLLDELSSKYGRKLHKSSAIFELAKNYCTLFAIAACFQIWIHNRTALGEFFMRGEWLHLALLRLMGGLSSKYHQASLFYYPEEYVHNVSEEMVRLLNEKKFFSIIPFQLA